MYKGIFWYVPAESGLLTVKVACNKEGQATTAVVYSSKSGNNFNHQAEWEKLPKTVTKGLPYNYYPRGRVEIKKGHATVYLNTTLNRCDIHQLICSAFSLDANEVAIRFVGDGSAHYKALIDI